MVDSDGDPVTVATSRGQLLLRGTVPEDQSPTGSIRRCCGSSQFKDLSRAERLTGALLLNSSSGLPGELKQSASSRTSGSDERQHKHQRSSNLQVTAGAQNVSAA